MNPKKGAFVVRLMDGLGNQLFQYALGRRLSLRQGAELVLDTSWFRTGGTREHPRPLRLAEFAVAGRFAEPDEFRDRWLRPTPLGRFWWRFEQRVLPLRWRRFVEQDPKAFARRGQMFDPEILRVAPGTYLSGYWISPLYFEGAERELRQELILRGPLSLSAGRWAKELGECESVALHVRRGDYVHHPEIGVLGADYYRRAIELLEAQRRDLRYFVFSDDPPAALELLAGIVPKFQVVTLEPGTSPSVDLALMATCKHFVIANSTFSWWGAWLSGYPGKLVMAPEHWFQGARVSLPDVYPAAWARVAE